MEEICRHTTESSQQINSQNKNHIKIGLKIKILYILINDEKIGIWIPYTNKMVNKIMSYQRPIKMNIVQKTALNWMKKVHIF
jgi:hypothetical protein